MNLGTLFGILAGMSVSFIKRVPAVRFALAAPEKVLETTCEGIEQQIVYLVRLWAWKNQHWR